VKEFPNVIPNAKGNICIQFESGSADKPEINAIEIGQEISDHQYTQVFN
jgi:hypothetical protein